MDEFRGKTLDTIAIAALVALWAETLVSLPQFPSVVATSFGNDGMPQAYGSKYVFLLLPLIATLICVIVAFALRSGYMRLNVPFTIPEERMSLIRPLNEQMQRVLRAELLVGFTALQWGILESARNSQLVHGFPAIVLTTVLATFALVAWFMYRVWTISRGGPSTGSG